MRPYRHIPYTVTLSAEFNVVVLAPDMPEYDAALLYEQAEAYLKKVIRPALEGDNIVLVDIDPVRAVQ